MNVRELDSELVLGTKYVVECEQWQYDEYAGEYLEDIVTKEFEVGKYGRNEFMSCIVLSIRVAQNKLYVRVSNYDFKLGTLEQIRAERKYPDKLEDPEE